LAKVEEALIYFVGYPVPASDPEAAAMTDPNQSIRAGSNQIAAQFGHNNP
jgi:hypothetical protein